MTNWIRVSMAKLRGLVGQQRVTGELEHEIQLHIQMLKERFSFATGIFFGLAPAWQAARIAARAGVRESGGATASPQRLRFDKTLVIGQIAISAILLMGAGLFVHTLLNLNHIPLGFESNHILLFRLNPPALATAMHK